MPDAAVDISVVAPCYNERQVLPEFYRRVAATLRAAGKSYEIVLVNDGSRDETWQIMLGLSHYDPAVVAVNLSRNHGHQLALTAGLSVCRGQRILIIDADLQDPPELLPRMMEVMDGGADVVYGRRQKRAGETAFKLATASLFYTLIDKLTDTPIPRDTGDFRLMSRRALNVLMSMPERHRFIRGMVSWIGFRQEPILYDRDKRFAGETKYPFRKMFKFALDAITAFSIKPLAMASYVGLASAVFAVLLIAYSLFSKIFLKDSGLVPGWTSLMAGIALLGGVQLLVLGIMGEYVGRLYEQAKGRPLFIIENIVRSSEAHTEGAGDTSSRDKSA